MRVPFRKLGIFAAATFVLAVILILAAKLLQEDVQNGTGLLPMAVMFLIGISLATMFILLPLLAIIEVVRSNNETRWKVMWITLIFVFSVFGLLAYLLISRKNLREN